jgi:hypothetical protein
MTRLIPVAALILGAGTWATTSQAQLVDEHGVDLLAGGTAYLLTNLHPDEERARLYAVNYQQPGLLRRCTEVRLNRIRRDVLRFTVVERDREYEYINHEAAAEPFEDHLLHFFGSQCDPSVVEQMSEEDQEGIRAGRASPGMTRQGVIYALGYPPRHVNPSLEADEWTYWSNRFNRFVVWFDDEDIVERIVD